MSLGKFSIIFWLVFDYIIFNFAWLLLVLWPIFCSFSSSFIMCVFYFEVLVLASGCFFALFSLVFSLIFLFCLALALLIICSDFDLRRELRISSNQRGHYRPWGSCFVPPLISCLRMWKWSWSTRPMGPAQSPPSWQWSALSWA